MFTTTPTSSLASSYGGKRFKDDKRTLEWSCGCYCHCPLTYSIHTITLSSGFRRIIIIIIVIVVVNVEENETTSWWVMKGVVIIISLHAASTASHPSWGFVRWCNYRHRPCHRSCRWRRWWTSQSSAGYVIILSLAAASTNSLLKDISGTIIFIVITEAKDDRKTKWDTLMSMMSFVIILILQAASTVLDHTYLWAS